MRATYSPDDNKLRLYPDFRLDPVLYGRVKKAGFIWAPKQDLFVAPMWTPLREDLLIELCGEIEDEDTSLLERAQERSERFEKYSDHREADATRAKKAVDELADNIPFGQPILIGHHSEKRARRDAEKIRNGMSKAVKMWETSKYWSDRAAGAIHHAKYKELPRVRANRIKRIEADLRKKQRERKEAEEFKAKWNRENLTFEGACNISNYDWITKCFTLSEYPRDHHLSEERMSIHQALKDKIIDEKEASAIATRVHEKTVAWCDRWIVHFTNRLVYEKAMLEEQGALKLIEKKPRPKVLPLLNYEAPDGISVENIYHRGEFSVYPQIRMTKSEYTKIYESRRGTATIEGTHRVRICSYKLGSWSTVFLTDSKVHEKPEKQAKPEEKKQIPQKAEPAAVETTLTSAQPERTVYDDMKDSLKQGIKIVSAPGLFTTPRLLSERMVSELDIENGNTILEPSAGTGNLIMAVQQECGTRNIACDITAIELNYALSKDLERFNIKICCTDFMAYSDSRFDRIIMNPPFENGKDIDHVLHAFELLKDNGKIVAIMSEGSFYRSDKKAKEFQGWMQEIGRYSEKLPEDSFKQSGTSVNTRLVIIQK